jgi:hypothetical protein
MKNRAPGEKFFVRNKLIPKPFSLKDSQIDSMGYIDRYRSDFEDDASTSPFLTTSSSTLLSTASRFPKISSKSLPQLPSTLSTPFRTGAMPRFNPTSQTSNAKLFNNNNSSPIGFESTTKEGFSQATTPRADRVDTLLKSVPIVTIDNEIQKSLETVNEISINKKTGSLLKLKEVTAYRGSINASKVDDFTNASKMIGKFSYNLLDLSENKSKSDKLIEEKYELFAKHMSSLSQIDNLEDLFGLKKYHKGQTGIPQDVIDLINEMKRTDKKSGLRPFYLFKMSSLYKKKKLNNQKISEHIKKEVFPSVHNIESFSEELLLNIRTIYEFKQNTRKTAKILKSLMGFSLKIGDIILKNKQTEVDLFVKVEKLMKNFIPHPNDIADSKFSLAKRSPVKSASKLEAAQGMHLVDWDFLEKCYYFNKRLEDLIENKISDLVKKYQEGFIEEIIGLKTIENEYFLKKRNAQNMNIINEVEAQLKANLSDVQAKQYLIRTQPTQNLEKIEKSLGVFNEVTQAVRMRSKKIDSFSEVYNHKLI